jgi:hypothetical protein
MPEHIKAARNAILSCLAKTGKSKFVDGKMISSCRKSTYGRKNGVQLGRLSGNSSPLRTAVLTNAQDA